ncbi:HAUS augmin-like complex subunit 6 [Heterocephalus glaber]|uniref:HAUS augmin-like complex subunit 6 n=1 Tax=Heterocephalus glaber TaxID=10181 RepID=G5B2K2_HETGA|nr:HAUS augmin-like complex subunit 6 [Heterocephalus glaber]
MSSARVTSFEKQHLWMYLRALGFEPGAATVASGKIANMFDKLNRDAFQIVAYFLFQTLDQSLTKEVFKFCWPPLDQKRDTEFRKHCCEWLKKISAECGSSFPQVVGSLFLSPGGPKFIHLMYHFARFVAIKYIKANSKNSSLHFTETFNIKTQDMHKCLARCHIARNRFFQILQRQDYVIQKYQENAQMEPSDDQNNIKEKIQKVRSLWALVNETLTFLEKERDVINSVLSLVNQYELDGTKVVINIPSLLLDNIKKQMCQLHIGNVYEAGKLNLLTVIQLLNEVLKVMKYERCQADQARFTIDRHYLEKETKFQRERLSDLKRMRCKIKEDLTTIQHSVVEKQREWHKKWKEFLGVSPFSLFKGWTPDTVMMRAPKEKDEVISKEVPEFEGEDSPLLDIANTDNSVSGGYLPAQKSDPFQKEQDHLVEEVTRAVLSDSPQVSEGKGVKLVELIDSVISNPFLSRKQIPRTPESLITEIRSSWRKAIEMEDVRSTEPVHMDTDHGEILPESLPVLHNREFSMASFFSDFDQSYLPEEKIVLDCLEDVPQKHVVTSHTGKPPTEDKSNLLNKKIICKQDLECKTLLTTLSETSPIEAFSPSVHNRTDVMMDRSKDKYIKTSDHSQTYNETSMHKTVLWDSFPTLSGISSKSLNMDFGILHETLPEEVGHLSLNSSSSSETNFKLESNSSVHSGFFLDDVMEERQTAPESEFSLQAIHNSYEALKKSLSKTRGESHLSNFETLERHKPEVSPTSRNLQADNMLHFLDTDDLLIDYAKASLRMSLGERKRSLSPLIKFSPVEQKLRTPVPCSLEEPCSLGELRPNLKEEILNKSLDAKESDSTS